MVDVRALALGNEFGTLPAPPLGLPFGSRRPPPLLAFPTCLSELAIPSWRAHAGGKPKSRPNRSSLPSHRKYRGECLSPSSQDGQMISITVASAGSSTSRSAFMLSRHFGHLRRNGCSLIINPIHYPRSGGERGGTLPPVLASVRRFPWAAGWCVAEHTITRGAVAQHAIVGLVVIEQFDVATVLRESLRVFRHITSPDRRSISSRIEVMLTSFGTWPAAPNLGGQSSAPTCGRAE